MAAGLQIWDENGFLIVDTTHNVPRYVGQVYKEGDAGQLSHSAISGGRCIIMVVCEAKGFIGNGTPFRYLSEPNDLIISQQGNAVTWRVERPSKWNGLSAQIGHYATIWVQ